MWRAACCAGTREIRLKITLRLELQDQDGEAVTVGADDSVTVRFYDEQNAPVHTFSFTGVTGNCVTLTFDETVSAKFPQGAYFYDILYTHGDRRTRPEGRNWCTGAQRRYG